MPPFWLIPIFPFAGALINGLFGRRLGMKGTAAVAMATVFASFLLAMWSLFSLLGLPAGERTVQQVIYPWIVTGNLHTDIGFLLDPLSAVMISFVTGVGFLIHVYSRGYIAEDPGAWRYFAYLNLFMGSMLVLVLGNNLLLMFLGWEGVGLCSYLLIGFWYEKKTAADAGKKAFIVNRVGDYGFLLGMFLIFTVFGSLNFVDIRAEAPHLLMAGGGMATAIGLLLFVGATGKSAQIPLYVWLPDAMEGPTPVSALIHAATMVTAGVYMVARMSAIYVLAPDALFWVAVIGCGTALYAATIGTAQDDIKRVLAYSTISQLGYMFLACGVGAFAAGIFHVMTHAFFKALLFLGSGAVIHALSEEQNIWRMGGLQRFLPVTSRTFYIGCLAIAGIPPLAGFFSKDKILEKTFASGNLGLYVIALFTAGLTAFYMFRLYFVTFKGKSRMTPEVEAHVHRPSNWMRVPLVVLAILSVVGGLVGLPIVPGGDRIGEFLSESMGAIQSVDGGHAAVPGDGSFASTALAAAGHGAATEGHGATTHAADGHHLSLGMEIFLMVLSVIVALIGIYIAWQLYLRRPGAAQKFRESPVGQLVSNKYYIDELNDLVFIRTTRRLANFLWRDFDVLVIDGLVNGSGRSMRAISEVFRRTQTGQVQAYVVALVVGCAAVLVHLVLKK